MSITNDRNLLYLAKEALKAKIPSNWKPCMDRNSQIWYYNVEDKRLIKEHPCDEVYRKRYQQEKANASYSQVRVFNQPFDEEFIPDDITAEDEIESNESNEE